MVVMQRILHSYVSFQGYGNCCVDWSSESSLEYFFHMYILLYTESYSIYLNYLSSK